MLPTVDERRVERWLGRETTERIVAATEAWYGPPIPVAGMPGRVLAARGGHFVGRLRPSRFVRFADAAAMHTALAVKRWTRSQRLTMNAGFASLSDLISEMTAGGKGQMIPFVKAGTAGIAARSNSLWRVGASPVAGAAGGTTGTGEARTRTTQGALGQADAGSGDQLHLTTMVVQASVAGQMLLLYDRLWDMTHTMTVAPRSCDAANVPTRYQTAELAPGNFLSGEVTTVLPAATPTVTFDYVDQDGNNATGAALSTIYSAAAVNTVPFTAGPWFYPLLAGDTGLRSLQNSANAVNLSAAMASGVVTWFIGHPLAFVPMGAANTPVILDGINSAFNLQRIYDDACLAFMEIAKGATTATNWWGTIQAVSG